MSATTNLDLSGVSETLLVTLYLRAMETQRPDALIHDEPAVALVRRIGGEGRYDFGRTRLLRLSEANKLAIVLRSRRFDRTTREFLERHPDATVVHIGCGLDARFERLDNGRVAWYDLDLPDIVALRRKLIGGERERYHLLGCSALEDAWLEAVSAGHGRPHLFVAEGVCMYFTAAQNRSLVRTLRDRFPGAEWVFDVYSPFHKIVSDLQSARFGFRTQWAIWHGEELEKWAPGIRLLDEWGFMDEPEPRVERLRWLRPFESLARTLRIYHFRLGEAAG